MITKERAAQLFNNWKAESNDVDAEEWRESLTREEAALVDMWDHAFWSGIDRMLRDAVEKATRAEKRRAQAREEAWLV